MSRTESCGSKKKSVLYPWIFLLGPLLAGAGALMIFAHVRPSTIQDSNIEGFLKKNADPLAGVGVTHQGALYRKAQGKAHQSGEPKKQRDIIKADVDAIRNSGRSIDMSSRSIAENVLAHNEDFVSDLVGMLTKFPVQHENSETRQGRDEEVFLRMKAIDVLEILAREQISEDSSEDAKKALMHIASSSHNLGTSVDSKKMALAERFDALSSLARMDPYLAGDILQQESSPERKAFLRGALRVAGLDQGINREKLKEWVESIEMRDLTSSR